MQVFTMSIYESRIKLKHQQAGRRLTSSVQPLLTDKQLLIRALSVKQIRSLGRRQDLGWIIQNTIQRLVLIYGFQVCMKLCLLNVECDCFVIYAFIDISDYDVQCLVMDRLIEFWFRKF